MKADQFKMPAWLARVSQLEDRAQALAERALDTDDRAAKALLIQQSRFSRGVAASIRNQVCAASLAAMKARPLPPEPKPSRFAVIAEGAALALLGLLVVALAALACAMHLHAFAK